MTSSSTSNPTGPRRPPGIHGDFTRFEARLYAAFRACATRVNLLASYRPGANYQPQLQQFIQELVGKFPYLSATLLIIFPERSK